MLFMLCISYIVPSVIAPPNPAAAQLRVVIVITALLYSLSLYSMYLIWPLLTKAV